MKASIHTGFWNHKEPEFYHNKYMDLVWLYATYAILNAFNNLISEQWIWAIFNALGIIICIIIGISNQRHKKKTEDHT